MDRKLKTGKNKDDIITNKYLNKKQLEAVELLLNGDFNKTEICEKLGISKMTLWRWEQDELFQAELKKETDELKAQAINFINRKAVVAAKKYWELAENADNRTKETALNNILNRSIGKTNTPITIEDNREDDGFDLEGALAEIRAKLNAENK